MRAEKLQRAASAVDGAAVAWLPSVSCIACGIDPGSEDGVMQSDQSVDQDVKDFLDDQQDVSAGCDAWADDEVSCFSKSATLLFDPETNKPLLVSTSPKKIVSTFSASACVPANMWGSSHLKTLARQRSQGMAFAWTTLSHSGSSNGGTGPVSGKRAYEQRAAVGEVGGLDYKVASPCGRLQRVRRVVRDLDRLDEP
ncbi:hypothetical protein PLESTB_001558100 [Pleodorina starrii]|uniref:Uncharacterized protein n=1 Tax=Pleodorina starrii TaxID=330485 RepID=A0A9W6BXL3_9CHLO|nr:hypothetical protein PLESTM_001474100 [Pleodorina starrii]GLC59958.1 hypothetical protein PLESTB_001558100 [Pleodorina starrii]GLC72813.1 hypothetical protein PLESTF_001296000 [Pleodorina starrii]